MAAKEFFSGTSVQQFCVELEDFEKHPQAILTLTKSRQRVLDLRLDSSIDCSTVTMRIFLVSMLILRRFGVLITAAYDVQLDTPLETLFKPRLAAQFRENRINAIRLVGVAVCNLMHIGAYRLAVAAHNCFLQLIWPLRFSNELKREDGGFIDYQLWVADAVMKHFDRPSNIYAPEPAFFAEKPDPTTAREVKLNGVVFKTCAHGMLQSKDGKCFLFNLQAAQESKAYCFS